MRKLNILLIIVFITNCSAYSQTNGDNLDYQVSSRHLSPEARQFEKYGNTPIRSFVGELDLSIPVYIYKDKDFTIPIQLVYNNDGFKPNEPEGIIGLGWNLNIGGAITRRVEGGVADEGNEGFVLGIIPAASKDIYKYSIPFNDKIKQDEILVEGSYSKGLVNAAATFGLVGHKNPNYGSYGELGPDMFNFHMPGHSGRFNLTWDGNIQVKDCKPYKILFSQNFSSNTDATRYITIISDNGYQYIFGGNINAVETSTSYPDPKNAEWQKEIVSAWFLTKIIAPNKRTIEFKYKERSNYIGKGNIAIRKNVKKAVSTFVDQTTGAVQSGIIPSEGGYNYEVIKQTYLEKIIIDTHTSIDLVYKQKEKIFYSEKGDLEGTYNSFLEKNLALNGIRVILNNEIIRSIEFSQKDLGSQYTRFFLTNISIGDEKYSFDYYNTDNIPRPDQSKIDHWGYFNGPNNNKGIIPTMEFAYGYFNIFPYPYFEKHTTRKADEESSKIGAIKRIIYPTGGGSYYYYEAHKNLKYEIRKMWNNEELLVKPGDAGPPVLGITGGVRIKTIEDFDENLVISNKRDFIYNKGILTHYPTYVKEKTSLSGFQYIECYVLPTARPNYPVDKHVQYSEIVEKNNNGSILYKYTSYIDEDNRDLYDKNIPYFVYNPKASWFPMPEIRETRGMDRSYRRGLLTEKIYLNNSGDSIYKEQIKYDILRPSLNNYTMALYMGEAITSKYRIENYAYVPIENKITHYYGDKVITRTKKFEYDERCSLKSEIDIDNNITTSYIYPYNLTTPPYTNMVNQNIISPVIERIVSKNSKLLFQDIKEYSEFSTNHYLCSKIYSVIGENGLKVLNTEFNKYDIYGNPLQISEKNNTSVTYLWSYNYQYPIAEIKNATYADIIQILGQTLVNRLSSSLMPLDSDLKAINDLRANTTTLKDALITTYTFKPLVGMLTSTDPSNMTTYYEYDDNNRLRSIKDNDKKVISHYGYNLFPYPPIEVVFNPSIQNSIDNSSSFSVYTKGGSNQFLYSWTIKRGSGEILLQSAYSSQSFIQTSFKHADIGSASIICNIKDANTGKIITESRDIEIIIKPLTIDVITESEYYTGASKSFKASVTGGSGNFAYDWILKDVTNSSNIITLNEKLNTTNEYSILFSKAGKMQLTCNVKDKTSGKSLKITKDIYIRLMTIDLSYTIPCVMNGINTFYTRVQGGSNNYTYSWILKSLPTNEIISKTSAFSSINSYSPTLNKVGKMQITCLAKDVQSSLVEEKTFDFDVIPPLIEFKDVINNNEPIAPSTTTATIDCYEAVTITLELNSVYMNSRGSITYKINNGSNIILNKNHSAAQVEHVTVSLPRGKSNFEIKTQKSSGSANTVQGRIILYGITSITTMQIGGERILMSGI